MCSGGTARAAGYDCLGQRALLGAFQGELRVAERHAAPVLKNAAAGGLAHAHLATAWVHLERAEPTPARQHLDRAVEAFENQADPWFVLVQLLAEARLLRMTNEPEAALRLLLPALSAERAVGQSGWLVDQLSLACAETLLAAGEPRRALDLVTALPPAAALEGGVLAASAHFELGDAEAAFAALAAVAGDLAGVPLGVQVDCWMLEARLAHDAGRTGPGTRPGGPRAANCRRGDASTTRSIPGRRGSPRSSRMMRRCAGRTVVSSPGSGLRRSVTRRG